MRILPRRRLAIWATAVMLLVLISVIALAFVPSLPIIHAAGPTPPPSAAAFGDSHLAELDWTAPSDPSVVGYYVTWTCGSCTSVSFFTRYLKADIQPLANNTAYTASVASVDANGTLSATSTPALENGNTSIYTSDTAVSQLRQQMNGPLGFFQDYNTSSTRLDPRINYLSYNNSIAPSAIFPATDQDHLHFYTLAPAGQNDSRDVDTMRILKPLNWTNGTATIAFDFDFGVPPIQPYPPQDSATDIRWYVNLSPTESDDTTNLTLCTHYTMSVTA